MSHLIKIYAVCKFNFFSSLVLKELKVNNTPYVFFPLSWTTKTFYNMGSTLKGRIRSSGSPPARENYLFKRRSPFRREDGWTDDL